VLFVIAEEALERSGMSYCIVRPGGMERPTDDYKRTHNLTLKPRDSTFGGQVRAQRGISRHAQSAQLEAGLDLLLLARGGSRMYTCISACMHCAITYCTSCVCY
jgi:hypothetical protein